MPDVNTFLSQDETIDRISEKIQTNIELFKDAFFDLPPVKFLSDKILDNLAITEDAFLDSPPAKLLSDGDVSMVAPIHSHGMLNDVHYKLSKNDVGEAADQLRREVDFCNAVPKMAGSPYEKSGKAGLDALNKNKSAAEIDRAMTAAWDKAWAENPDPFYDTKK